MSWGYKWGVLFEIWWGLHFVDGLLFYSHCLDLVQFRPSGVNCRFLLLAWHIFLWQIIFLSPDCILWLRVLKFPVLFHFFANILMSSMYIRWLIFSCDLLSLYPAVLFLSMWLSGIIAIMNSSGDSASLWNIPLWTLASAKLRSPAINSTFQVFMVFSIKFMTSSDILYFLRLFIIQLCGNI